MLFYLADLDLVLSRDQDLVNVVGQAHGLNLGLEGIAGAGFVAGVGVNDVPLGISRIVWVDDEMILIFFGHFVLSVYDAAD